MEKYIEQLKPLFEKVGEKIGQGAAFTWEIVLRQQIAYGIIAIFIGLCGLIGIFWLKKIYQNLKIESNNDIDWEDDCLGYIFLFLFGGVFSAAMFIIGTINAILYLTNPSYYALQFFINLVK